MSPAYDQPDARERIFVERDAACVNVRLKMIDRNQRLIRRDAERLCRGESDEERPRQSRLVDDRDRVQLVERNFRLTERVGDDGKNRLHVRSGRDFRHDAAVEFMDVDLRREGRAEDASRVVDDGGGGLVAARFDRKYLHCGFSRRLEFKNKSPPRSERDGVVFYSRLTGGVNGRG